MTPLAWYKLSADALHGLGGYENIVLSLDTQELSTMKSMSEGLALSELEAMERDIRFKLFSSKSAIPERCSENTKYVHEMP